jgi:hypothetical protein
MCAEKEKPKRKEDGFYWFVCEECGKDFPAKDPRAKTCDQRCRNAKNKRRKSFIEKTEDEFTVKYKHNSKVLRRLAHEKIIIIEEQTLILARFHNDIKVLTTTVDKVEYQIFGDFAIGRIGRVTFKLIPKHEL